MLFIHINTKVSDGMKEEDTSFAHGGMTRGVTDLLCRDAGCLHQGMKRGRGGS